MQEQPKILVTGKDGQLGSELQDIAKSYPQFNFVFTDRSVLDITDSIAADDYFSKVLPQFCINAAAYTAVDKAENERDLAMKVNADAVGNLAKACKKYNATFIHISTDYVFDGTASSPYPEDHKTNPVNFYGLTKLKGEEAAIFENPTSIIIRTSWVYSKYGNNFVKTMLRLMSERPSINVVNDQFGSPTNAADLAEAILQMIQIFKKENAGIYHYSNSGEISWFEFAQAIKKYSGSSCDVLPIPTSAYPTPAKRPSYSVFLKTKIASTFGIEIKDWKTSLCNCIASLHN